MINYLKEEAFGITKRIKNRDFSGNTGLAVKNSIFQFFTTIIGKVGSILFTIIIARMLLPELFGLYSLALATIFIFSGLSDLGVATTLVRFLSRELANKKGNPRGYYLYIRKLKATLTILTALILAIFAYFIANVIYHKPLFYALLAGSIYILINQFLSFFSDVFRARNDFKKPLIKEVITQIFRLVLVPLTILVTISLSTELALFWIFLSLIAAYFLALLYLLSFKPKFFGEKLPKHKKKELNKFILPLTAMTLSGIFAGHIDQIMLGRYLPSEFVGYYAAAFGLIGSAGALIAFSGSLFPIFSRLKGSRLETGLKKAIFVTFPVAILALIVTIFIAKYVVLVIYGIQYTDSVFILQLLSPLLITSSLTGIYSNYFITKGKTVLVATLLITTTTLNILLNYLLINYGLQFSLYIATTGAAIATVLSQIIYLDGLFIAHKISSLHTRKSSS